MSAGTIERDAFGAWVDPHWATMAHLARRLAPPGEWEDVLQEALGAAWRKRAQEQLLRWSEGPSGRVRQLVYYPARDPLSVDELVQVARSLS